MFSDVKNVLQNTRTIDRSDEEMAALVETMIADKKRGFADDLVLKLE